VPARVVAALLGLALVAAGAAATTDPYRSSQWGLERIAAPAAWATARGEGQVVAIVDSGVDLEHPDLVDRLLRDADGRVVGRDYVDDDDVPEDRNGHGTMVAGIAAAAADNDEGIAGVAPAARILPVRVLDAQGRGSAADVDEAIRWAVDHGATVVNLSLESVTPLPGSLIGAAPADAVRYAWDRGVAVVAAAGNSGSPFTDYPESSPVLLVGASDRDDERTGFSDRGRRDAVLAPGVGIVSTWCDPAPEGCHPDHRYGEADGTSFAAPSAAGALAILRAAGLDADEAVGRLRRTAVDLGEPGPDRATGWGRIDVAAAVGTVTGSAVSPPATPAPEPTAATTTPTAPPDDPPRERRPATAAPDRPPDDGADPGTGTPAPTPPAPDGRVGDDIVPHDPQAAGRTGRGRGAGDDAIRLVAAILVATTGGMVGSVWWQDRRQRR
jgi:subtilisin family serine protease